MRVRFQIDGGIAYFPGLSKPVTIDVTQLDQEDAAELRRLIDDAQFFELPTTAAARPRGAADYRQYTITVEDGRRRHTIHLADPIKSPALQALVDYLSQKAAQLRRSGGQSAGS